MVPLLNFLRRLFLSRCLYRSGLPLNGSHLQKKHGKVIDRVQYFRLSLVQKVPGIRRRVKGVIHERALLKILRHRTSSFALNNYDVERLSF